MHHTNTLKNNRILIIDDNPSIHEDIRKILGGWGNKTRLWTATKPCCSMTRFRIRADPVRD
jgi:CheY-like chemotaxis protein